MPESLKPVSFMDCTWLNKPTNSSVSATELKIVTDARTDFWRETHYGFERDSGHFLGTTVKGDFTAQIRIRAVYDQLYDQAGLMLRVDDRNWIKTGIEFTDGEHALSTVVTRGRSDWSVGALKGQPEDFRLRLTVSNGALRIQASTDGRLWPLYRLAPFQADGECRIGPMCCTPERAGLECRFSEFMIGPATSKDLHDLS